MIRKRREKIILITIGLLGCGLFYWLIGLSYQQITSKIRTIHIHYFQNPLQPQRFSLTIWIRCTRGEPPSFGERPIRLRQRLEQVVKGSDWIPFGIPLKPWSPIVKTVPKKELYEFRRMAGPLQYWKNGSVFTWGGEVWGRFELSFRSTWGWS